MTLFELTGFDWSQLNHKNTDIEELESILKSCPQGCCIKDTQFKTEVYVLENIGQKHEENRQYTTQSGRRYCLYGITEDMLKNKERTNASKGKGKVSASRNKQNKKTI